MDQSPPRIWFHILMILLLFFVHISTVKAKLCNPHDEQILLRYKRQLSPSTANQAANWNPKTDPDCCLSWSGIACNKYGRVTSLSFKQFDASGASPPTIGELPFVVHVNLSGPGVSGPFPSAAICKLTKLDTLEVTFTNMFGRIPDCIGRLSRLTNLVIKNNKNIYGPIPKSLGLLRKLVILNLQFNNLSGPIPTQLSKLSNLQELSLQNNQLSGSIPASLGNITKLRVLYLSTNNLTGTIPDSFGSFKPANDRFLFIILHNNQLTGTIPRSLGQLTSIRYFMVNNNNLHGDPSFMLEGSKKFLYALSLGNNNFKFNLSKVKISDQLAGLDINHNKVYGSLPNKLGQTIQPKGLFDVSFNELCGPIPLGLQKFRPNFFVNNSCLCGPPLSVPCPAH